MDKLCFCCQKIDVGELNSNDICNWCAGWMEQSKRESERIARVKKNCYCKLDTHIPTPENTWRGSEGEIYCEFCDDRISKKEDLKPECDHIVALREVMSVICLPLSKLKELSDLHKKDGTWEEIFYWLGEEECTSRECPLCCEKLDWEAIEKQLNS